MEIEMNASASGESPGKMEDRALGGQLENQMEKLPAEGGIGAGDRMLN